MTKHELCAAILGGLPALPGWPAYQGWTAADLQAQRDRVTAVRAELEGEWDLWRRHEKRLAVAIFRADGDLPPAA